MATGERYTGTRYVETNPSWHVEDSPWKAEQLLDLLQPVPESVCEVGSGAGEILRQIHDRLPGIRRLVGYEIASAAHEMALGRSSDRLAFKLADATEDSEAFDVMLIMDVIEHVPDPIGFLEALRFKAPRLIVHIPLDLSIQALARPQKLMRLRRDFGHIHYFTPETATATVREAGYDVRKSRLTRSFDLPAKSRAARMARLPRRVLPADLTVRLLGGYSLLVDATRA